MAERENIVAHALMTDDRRRFAEAGYPSSEQDGDCLHNPGVALGGWGLLARSSEAA